MKSLLLIFLGGGTGSVLSLPAYHKHLSPGNNEFSVGYFRSQYFGLHTDRGILYPHLTHSYQQ